jgi:hypothetical protein
LDHSKLVCAALISRYGHPRDPHSTTLCSDPRERLVRISEAMSRLRRPTVHSKERLSRLADEELMPLVAAGDADAFEVVLERHADAVFSLEYM